MTTQMDVSSQNTVVQGSGVKQKINWMVTVNAGLMVVLIMGILVTLRPLATDGAQPVAEGDTSLPPAFQADAARYSALAEFYKTQDEIRSSSFLASNPELSMAQRYIATKDSVSNQRALEADAARYRGMAEFYTAENETSSTFLAANPELSTVHRNPAGNKVTESDILAAKRELVKTQLYVDEVKQNRIYFPGR